MGRAKSELVDGSTVIKKFTLTRHDRSEAHQLCMQREAARLKPLEDTEAAQALVSLQHDVAEKAKKLIRIAHALAKRSRPFTDFATICTVHEPNGIDLGQTYRNDKACKLFTSSIAAVEISKLKVHSVIFGLCTVIILVSSLGINVSSSKIL